MLRQSPQVSVPDVETGPWFLILLDCETGACLSRQGVATEAQWGRECGERNTRGRRVLERDVNSIPPWFPSLFRLKHCPETEEREDSQVCLLLEAETKICVNSRFREINLTFLGWLRYLLAMDVMLLEAHKNLNKGRGMRKNLMSSVGLLDNRKCWVTVVSEWVREIKPRTRGYLRTEESEAASVASSH